METQQRTGGGAGAGRAQAGGQQEPYVTARVIVGFGNSQRADIEERAATICGINREDRTVNLATYNPDGTQGKPMQHVPFAETLTVGSWTWPATGNN